MTHLYYSTEVLSPTSPTMIPLRKKMSSLFVFSAMIIRESPLLTFVKMGVAK